MTLEDLIIKANELNVSLTAEMIQQLNCYASYLREYNENVNLTAITEYEDVLDKHFYDSLLANIKKLDGTLVDVGTGAGFPGVVLKIVNPDLKVILIEPIMKRCVFLNSLIEKINLKNIEVLNVRAEDYSKNHREEYDFVTARAVSNLNILIEVCGALVKKDGYFICLRAKDGLLEIKNANDAISLMGFKVEDTYERSLMDGATRIISYFRKIKNTPQKYPRKYNIIKQKNL